MGTRSHRRSGHLVISTILGFSAAGVLLLDAAPARASHENTSTLTLVGLLMANMTMMPSYYSVGYYGFAARDMRMPSGWVTMNCVTGALGASVGFYGIFKAADTPDLDHGRVANHTEVLMGVFGGFTVATSVAVIASSLVMGRRPGAEPPKHGGVDPQKRWMVMPQVGMGERGRMTGGLGVVGVF